MEIKKIKEEIFEKAREVGFLESEIYISQSSSFKVSVYKSEIEKFQNSESGGLCFRGIIDGKMGYYFSEQVENINPYEIVKGARENAILIESEDEEEIFAGSKEYKNFENFDEEIEKLSVEEKIKMAFEMEELVKGEGISVNSSTVAKGKTKTYIFNTKGLELEKESCYILAYIEAMATKGEQTKEMGKSKISVSLKDFDYKKICYELKKDLIASLGAEPIESGKQKVLLRNEVFADLLSCFVGNFYAENVQKGFSRLKGKIGEKVGVDFLTITDNPFLKGGLDSCNFDSEGVATYEKKVIEKGILKTFLYNLKAAKKDGVSSTGNGFKDSFKAKVRTSCTNFYVEKGELSFESLIKEVENGILITDVAGLHSGTNSISGDFSVACEGFLIKNGKIDKPLNQIVMADNFYDMLFKIQKIGKDLEFYSSIASPSIIVSNVNISGI